jgi:hypothetical protein
MLHRLYKFDLPHRPNLMDKDAYFIPAGYDSLPLLRNNDVSNDLSKLYEERVPYVKPKNIVREEEIICEDLSTFLSKFTKKKTDLPSDTKLKEEDVPVDRISSLVKKAQPLDFGKFQNKVYASKGFNSEYNSNLSVKEESEKKDIV